MKVTLTVHGKELNGEVFEFTEPGSFLFGSSQRAQCRVTGDPYLSRSHFHLIVDPAEVRLRDLQSTNGTEVDGVLYTGGKDIPLDEDEEFQTFVKGEDPPPGEEVLLHDGSVIEAGYTKLLVSIMVDEECNLCGAVISHDQKVAAQSNGDYVCEECREKQKKAWQDEAERAAAASREREERVKRNRLKRLVAEGNQLLMRRQGSKALEKFQEAAAIDPAYPGVEMGKLQAQRLKARSAGVPDAKPGARPGPAPPMGTGPSDDLLNRILAQLKMAQPQGTIPVIPGYRIVRLLDKGGMGAVFEAVKLDINQTVAIKVILPDRKPTRSSQSRFRAETRLTRELSHPNIVTFIDGGDANGLLWLALEFVPEGLDVEKKMKRSGGRLPQTEALDYILQALQGLAYAHERHVIHRDIKPPNILLAPNGSRLQSKLSDFGLAKSLERAELNCSFVTRPNTGMGTLFYMPPEQVIDVRSAEPPADVFSMGATLYQMLTGKYVRDFARTQNAVVRQLVQERTVPIEIRDSTIPKPLCIVINQSLSLEPAARYPDGAEFKKALERAAG